MSISGLMRKARLLLVVLVLGITQCGCVATLDRAVGGLFEAVVETTVDAVADAVVDTTVNAISVGADMVVSGAIACIDNDRPVLSGALPNPALNQPYNAIVHVGIRNEPYDNAYAYAFKIHGDFPAGMSSESVGRQLRLTGTPTRPGQYNFQISVSVEDGLYGASDTDGLCDTTDNEQFQWTIQQSDYARFTS